MSDVPKIWVPMPRLEPQVQIGSAMMDNCEIGERAEQKRIERGLRAVLDDLAGSQVSSDRWVVAASIHDVELPRLVEIFQKAAKQDG